MNFTLDRLDGTLGLSSLRPENVSVRGDKAMIELALPAALEVELYFPALDGAFEPEWLSLAGDVLTHLTSMDNEVQRACAEAWAKSKASYPSSYYEGDLAYITLIQPDEVVLHYFVIGCNAEWDERFVRSGGEWTRLKPA